MNVLVRAAFGDAAAVHELLRLTYVTRRVTTALRLDRCSATATSLCAMHCSDVVGQWKAERQWRDLSSRKEQGVVEFAKMM